MYSAVTRPRTAGAVEVCMVALVVTLTTMANRPMGTMSSAKLHRVGATAATACSTPKASAARKGSLRRVASCRAASSAPVREPAATRVLKRL